MLAVNITVTNRNDTQGAAVLLRCLALSVCSCAIAQAAELTIEVAYGDLASAPFILGEGTKVPAHPGAAVDLMLEASGQCGLSPRLSRWPSNRLWVMISADKLDAALMYSANQERMQEGVFPMRGSEIDRQFRIVTLIYSFYVMRDSGVLWDGQHISNLPTPIGANIGWSVVSDLRARGLQVDELSTTEGNFRKLQAGHISAFAIQDHIADRYLQLHPDERIIKLSPAISHKDYYLALSHAWYKAHPAEANCLWKNLATLRDTRLPTLMDTVWKQQ
jgi:polar amino acid transport system substrate-binding protein